MGYIYRVFILFIFTENWNKKPYVHKLFYTRVIAWKNERSPNKYIPQYCSSV